MSGRSTLLVCVIILLVAAGVTAVVFNTEPTALRVGATKETAMLVDVTQVERGTFRPTIVAMGAVEPAQEINLSPRVSGEIIERAPSFTPGGRVEKGTVLLRIDPADYENALEQRRSELHRAEADLAIEMGRQNVAEKDLQLFEGELSAQSQALVLREPQLNTARAAVEAARAAVAQAQLDLERTWVRAPFDAHVLERHVNIGSQVSPGDELGHLVGIDHYWVVATVPLSKLRWIAFPDSSRPQGSLVRLRDDAAWPQGVYRTGRVYSLVGALEGRTRMARVIVSIGDPLGYRDGSADEPPLMIGSYVEARIEGEEIGPVTRLDRDLLRQGDTTWVMEDGQLRIRDLDIVFRDQTHAFVGSGLEGGDMVVTTNLSTVTEGAALRLEGSSSSTTGDSARVAAADEELR